MVMLSFCQQKPKNHDASARPGVVSCFLVAFAMPLWLRCSHQGPDWTRGTLHSWYMSSVASVVLPYVVALCQGWEELTTLSMIQPTDGQYSSTLSIPGHLHLAMVGAW